MNVTKPAKYAPPKYRWRNVIIPNNSKFHIFGRISPVKQKVQIAFQRILVRRSIHKTSIWRLANTDVFESGDPILSIDTLSHQTLKIEVSQLHNSLWFTSRTQNKGLRSQFSLKWGKFPCPMRCIKKYHCNNYSTFKGFTRDLFWLRKLSKVRKPALVAIMVLHRKVMSSRLSYGLSNNLRLARYPTGIYHNNNILN